MAWTNINPTLNSIADEQGIEPGSDAWINGGIMPYSGSTGGHPSYGWRHDYKLNEFYIRCVIANYGHRRCYYLNAPERIAGYEGGGRPIGWTPEDGKDLPDGQVMYLTSKGFQKVSGPDIQHFWIDPLFSIADSKGFTVKALGSIYPAELVAKAFIPLLVNSMAGQMRKYGKWMDGDRDSARILDTFVQANRRGGVWPDDAATAVKWLEDTFLPSKEKAPGIGYLTKDPSLFNGMPYSNAYQSFGWLIPAMYDTEMEIQKTMPEHAARIHKQLVRLSQWMLDLEEISEGRGPETMFLALPPEVMNGKDGEPLDSLKGVIKKEHLNTFYDFSLWSVRSTDIIRWAIPGEASEKMFKRVREKVVQNNKKPEDKVWLTDKDRNWLPGVT